MTLASSDMKYDKWFNDKKIVDYYYIDIQADSYICRNEKHIKYLGISKRIVYWFLLAKVHLYDCTLTYKKLWKQKEKYLKELEQVSINLYPDIYNKYHNINDYYSFRLKNENMNEKNIQLLKENDIKDYLNGNIHEPSIDNYIDLSDEKAKETVHYLYDKKYKGIYKFVDKFMLEVILYDLILVHTESHISGYFIENFGTCRDSSPMCVIEDVVCSCDMQYKSIKETVGDDIAKKIKKMAEHMGKYTYYTRMFDIYRTLY